MKFYDDKVTQINKRRQRVCGDYCLCQRRINDTIFALTDGVGSGIYANVAAIFCANRLVELYNAGVSQQDAAAMVAESMHRARQEDMPFAAFSLCRLLPDGQATVYTYEAPPPLLIRKGQVQQEQAHFLRCGYETIAETSGLLELGDTLVLTSDGVTQAGIGHGLNFGIGSEGLADYIRRQLSRGLQPEHLGQRIAEMAAQVSGGVYEDDTTVALLHCRQAKELTVFSGPPAERKYDRELARRFLETQGQVAICGSSTAEVISRESGREIHMTNAGALGFNSPPEYRMQGAAMVTEGAIVLSQTLNILEVAEEAPPASPAERLRHLMLEADSVTFVLGDALNAAHTDLLFRQMGVLPRREAIAQLSEKLRARGKLVVTDCFTAPGLRTN